jgi:choice-of-anchor B domain-containing protein
MRTILPIRLASTLIVATALPSAVAAQSYVRDDATIRPATGLTAALVFSGGELFAGRPGELAFFPSPANHAGAIHVFAPGDGEWAERTTITAPAVEPGDGFGLALDVAGDLMVVGAPSFEEGRGAAFVFERTDGAWGLTATLRSSDGSAANERTGVAVAIAGDVILVGAPGDAEAAGKVLVFHRGASGWTLETSLAPTGGEAGNQFGAALSATAERILIGASGPLPTQALFGGQPPRAGAAYIFTRAADGSWTEEARLSRTAEEPAGLGAAVLLADDEAYVGAPLAGQFAGAVVRYRRDSGGSWSQVDEIGAAEPAPGSGFGFAIAFAGPDLFVGAPLANGHGTAYVLRRDAEPSGGWSPAQTIVNETQFAFFGSALAGDSAVAVIGAPGADFFEGTGYAYRKDAQTGEWQPASTVITESESLEPITGDRVDCTSGQAGSFGCQDVDLVSFLPVSALGGKRGMIVNDLWGWTDGQTGKEYAIVGRADGTVFIDVSDPANPVYLGELPMHEGSTENLWRDMKVYADHVFIVADGAGPHGVQIFDLTRLRNVQDPPAAFTESAHYDRIHSAHNIVMNESTGFAYVVGASMGGETCGGGLHMIDVREPTNPKFAGCFADPQTGNARTGYSHDAQCIRYQGPDEAYRDHEICFGANETMLSISDVSDKANPVAVSRAAYPNVAYLHQGWVSDDHRYLFMNDEGDELAGVVPRTRTLVWDITDLDDPVLLTEYLGETAASDHNLYVRGNYIYESNYVSGLRIIDITDPANPKEVGFFDTMPLGDDAPGFAGSWSNYPYFESGNIVVTSMREGVFILRHRRSDRPIS